MSINITIMGASGRMGRLLIKAVAGDSNTNLHAAIVRENSPLIGKDAGLIADIAPLNIMLSDDAATAIANCDCVIDFSSLQSLAWHAELAASAGAAYICGITGLQATDERALTLAARHVPVVYAANTSVGVTMLQAIIRKAASILDDEYDIDILDIHHNKKIDAPSGTAYILGKAAAKGRKVNHDDVSVTNYNAVSTPRERGKIGYASLRVGNVIGEHMVVFANDSERIEITHKALTRDLFAVGAVKAAKWAAKKSPGLYSMDDVLSLGDI